MGTVRGSVRRLKSHRVFASGKRGLRLLIAVKREPNLNAKLFCGAYVDDGGLRKECGWSVASVFNQNSRNLRRQF